MISVKRQHGPIKRDLFYLAHLILETQISKKFLRTAGVIHVYKEITFLRSSARSI